MITMTNPVGEPIVIIGSACHFAGDVSSTSKLWALLRDPQDIRREIPNSRFSAQGFYHKNYIHPGHFNVRQGYLMNEDLSVFDATFFGLKPVEAKAVDPQQRWLMETVYEALEQAGLTIEGMRGSDTGVYVGVMGGDYEQMLLRDLQVAPTYFATGTARSILSNRISYFFDWRGPSVTIDTACSSSLVAVHMAVQALRAGDSRVALACGSNLILGPENYIIESKLKMLSSDGVGRMWDQYANGYARGDGVAVVILKTLSAALVDGDHIECIIRETGINQDGGTPGITIPSASAQEALIRNTYLKAGLDISKPSDRPQYFEAHGTGTPAGDPVEAEAIHRAFFEDGENAYIRRPEAFMSSTTGSSPLFVGSIKTILGHTEGTAGLAGILKASLALQNGVLPPNLHFNHLSERVAPFYKNIEVVQGHSREWPSVHGSSEPSRRASVNSFGFGGTNAHAILESYSEDANDSTLADYEKPLFTPFVFSASSENSLRAILKEYLNVLKQRPLLNPHDLAWTLRQRRSLLPHRASFAAPSVHNLEEQLSIALQDESSPVGMREKSYGVSSNTILGIFTGQGAQYARLGAELIEQSSTARSIILTLDTHLSTLPTEHSPSWSLITELLAPGAATRVMKAAIAQPLCTAVQIMLVDLLALAGVHFDVVVGHSSGEIAAAYAAGVLSARDAILVAYFRGVYVSLSASPNGSHIHGAMVAVGTSLEDAEDLCNDERYAGRLTVAACNSSSSVTISGDEDAIEELEELLEDEKKFHRRLRADAAYHSRHMDPCFTPYVEALRRCGVQALRLSKEEKGPRKCQWFSSVYDCAVSPYDDDDDLRLNDQYWAENMTRPVFFSQALRTALLCTNSRRFSVALEIGPHPALQGPAGQTIQETLGEGIPYHPTLFRGKNAVTALSSSLGFLWQQLQSNNAAAVPDLDSYERAMISDGQRNQQQQNDCRFKVVKGLPNYQWDHTTKHWAESRASRKMRLRRDIYHPLLGHNTPDSSKHHLRWRNLVREGSSENHEDILQLDGHRVQGQTVFPAAGYVATVVEAARALVSNDIEDYTIKKAKRVVRLIEIHNMVIHQAIVLSSDGRDGVEVLIELADITETPERNRIRARFSYSADLGHNDELTLTVSAEVEVLVGHGDSSLDPQLLPPRRPMAPHLIPVEKDRFYTSLATFGYEYEGAFKSLAELKRNYGKASCMVEVQGNSRSRSDAHSPQDDQAPILVHPADLDAAFQSLLLAYSYPGDHQLRTLHLPLSIECVRVNPALCGIRALQGEEDDLQQEQSMAAVDATVILPEENGQTLPSLSTSQGGCRGDISFFTSASPHAAIQVHNVQFVPVGGSSAEEEDRKVFSEMRWVNMAPDGLAAAEGIMEEPQKKRDQLAALHRLAVFYYRQFDAQVPIDSPLRLASKGGATALFLQYAQYVLSSLPDDWPYDGLDDIHKATEVCGDLPDVGVMHLVGQTMPRVFRGETTMLEAFRESGVLDDYYVHSFASAPSGQWQARLVEQIATRHPHLNILEIGAGTGGTTKPILNALGPCCRSYTFTDVSAGFFSAAATALSPFQDRLTFKSLDIERDPRTQGFQEGTYDLILASFVLHATASLSHTLANVRKLLRPGGYLVVGEGSIQTTSISSFIFGPLPGWWLGRDDGRILSPHVSAMHWDQLLRENGFSGIDTKAPGEWEDVLGVCLFSSQAIDDQVRFLRSPLSASNSPHSLPKMKSLWIVGGKTARTAQLVAATSGMLKPYAEETHIFPSLADVDYDGVIKNDSLHNTAVLSLVDLDKPVFKDMTERDFLPFQRMFREGKTLFWVTTGRRSEEPFSNMIVGFGRTAVHETPGLYLQHLDVADPQMKGAAYTIAENFLRFAAKTVIKFKEDTRLLWPIEPEIVVDLNGRHQVARLFPLRALNDRYNSGHRPIAEDVDISRVPVLLRPRRKSGGIELEKLRSAAAPEPRGKATNSPSSGPLLNLRITHALIPAIRTPFGHKFLALGAETSSGVVRLALLSSLASVVTIPTSSTLEFTEGSCMEAMIALSSMAHHLVALSILDPILPGQTVVIHNPTSNLVEAIHDQATEKGTEAVFVTDKGILLAAPPKVQILSLSQYMSQTELWKLLPAKNKISSFVSLTPGRGYDSESLHTILAGLPAWCRLETADVLFSQLGSEDRFAATEPVLLKQLLQKTVQYTHRYRRSDSQGTMPRVVDLERLVCKGDSANEGTGSLFTVVNLATSTRPLPAAIRRLDAGGRIFRADRTYWVVGLSGDLGISLCDWMIRTGARHLVITSRKPNIEQVWIDLHRQDGVIITILPCDITDYRALVAVHASISRMHPTIAGVFNGAMVLRDTSIRNMTFSQLNDVVRPKVMGSLNLDRIFSSTPLDFFVLFSSTNFIIGNQGQANYAAANAFQCALASSRRKRGLVATAVNIGAIIGAGYIQRSTNYKRVLDLTVTRGSLMHLSEEDFHQLIAEAIANDGDGVAELTTGVLEIAHDTASPPLWFTDPKFVHLVVQRRSRDGHDSASGSAAGANHANINNNSNPAAIHERIKASRSAADAEKVLTDAFAALLRQELQIADRDDSALMEMRSHEIGLDSLVSVDIRSWFLRAAGVSIPVLHIMSRNTMASLVRLAVESLPAEIRMLWSQTTSEVTGGDDLVAEVMDWEAETRPPSLHDDSSDLCDPSLESSVLLPSPPSSPPQTIVLTGTTGLLGSCLLNHVLQILPANGKVFCIGIRRRLTTAPDPRCIYYAGNLALPRLGLTPSACASIFAAADAVIHVGADTAHLKPYAALRQANVGSTAELARLCVLRKIPLHYVSTVGVTFISREMELRPERVGGGPPRTDSEGYTTSKWVCERLLERISAQTGLPVWIHRPSSILRLGVDNEGERASMDWLNGLLRYSRRLGAVPDVKYNQGVLDMVYPKTVCVGILQHLLDHHSENAEPQGVSYVHHVGDIVIPLNRMHGILELDLDEGCGQDSMANDRARTSCKVLPMAEWTARARAEGLHPAVIELIEGMDGPDRPHFPSLVKSAPRGFSQ